MTFKVTETSTFQTKTREQAEYISKLYSDLHALITCENSDHESEIRQVTTAPLCDAVGPREATSLCIRTKNHHAPEHEDTRGGTWFDYRN